MPCAVFLFSWLLVAAEERSEAAIGCAAVAKPFSGDFQVRCDFRFSEDFILGRSLAAFLSGYKGIAAARPDP